MASNSVSKNRIPARVQHIAAHEIAQLWLARAIIRISADAIGDEIKHGGLSVKEALQTAADVIKASIQELEPIAKPNTVKACLQFALAQAACAEVAHG